MSLFRDPYPYSPKRFSRLWASSGFRNAYASTPSGHLSRQVPHPPPSKRSRLSSDVFTSLSASSGSQSRLGSTMPDAGHAVSYSKVVLYGGRPRRLSNRGAGPAKYLSTVNWNYAASSASNAQQYFTINGEEQSSWATLLAGLQNELWAPQSGAVGTNYRKVWVHKADLEMMFKNDSNAIEFLYLYTIVPRHDTSYAADAAFSDVVNQRAALSGSGTSASTPLITPFQSSTFNTWWMVKDVKRVCLRPGEVHVHHQVYHINRMLDSTLITKGSTSQFLRGFFSGVLAVVVGSPVGGNGGEATFSATSILCTVQGRWDVRYVASNIPVNLMDDVNPLTPSTGNTDMNVTSGVIDVFQNIAPA